MFSFAWKMTWRDWRAGELRFLILALIVAVASLSSVGFFVDRMRNGLARDAHQLLAADLLISADKQLTQTWKESALQQSLQVAETYVMQSMAFVGSGEQSRAKLVSLKAVTSAYPLRGQLKVFDPATKTARPVKNSPAPGTVWVDPSLLLSLNVKVGDHLNLGDARFVITESLVFEPDRGSGFMNFAPRVMMAQSDLASTGLIQEGSRFTYRLLLAGDKSRVEQMEKTISAQIKNENLKGIRLETIENARPEMRATLDRAEQFLSLVSLLTALLAAVAVAMAARRFMLRHMDACAMLRCLGLSQNQVSLMYLIEFLWVGLLASVIGIVIGYAAHFVLLELLSGLLAQELPNVSLLPALQALVTGLLLLIGFALPPILQLRNVPHNRVIRREQDSPKPLTIMSYVLGLSMFVLLLLWQTGDQKVALMTAGGYLGGILIFSLFAWLSVWALKPMRNWFSFASWRFAITALQRRAGANVVQIVSLALGLMALLILSMVRGDLIAAWKQSTPANAPNQFVINIQPDQKEAVAQRIHALAEAEFYPMIRGRLLAVNQTKITATTYADERAKGLAEREFNLSTMTQLPELNKVVAGTWYDDEKTDIAEASVEEGLAKTLNLKLGDQLSFDIAGSVVEAKITSLRKLDWGSMRVNFFVVINPKAMQNTPRTWITAFRTQPEQAPAVQNLTQEFPNLTILNVSDIIQQLQDVLDQVTQAVEFLFFFTLVSGVMVLYAALAGSQDLRMREAALLRALGATKAQLLSAQRIEFMLIGGVAGLLAAAGASAIGYVLATYAFKFAWSFSIWVWLVGLLVGVICALIGGSLSLRQVLKHPPLMSLRESV